MTAALERFPDLRYAGLHVDHDTFSTGAARLQAHGERPDLDWSLVRAVFQRIKPGQYMTAHIQAYGELYVLLAELNFRVIVVCRDPRDIVVSTVMYIRGLPRHPLYRYFDQSHLTDQDRMLAIIKGFPANEVSRGLAPLGKRLEGFRPWLEAPNTWVCRFEDLVGQRGGGSDEVQLSQIHLLAEHIGAPIAECQASVIARDTWSKRTATFRTGATGGWVEWFDPKLREAFADEVSDGLLAAYGYLPSTCGTPRQGL